MEKQQDTTSTSCFDTGAMCAGQGQHETRRVIMSNGDENPNKEIAGQPYNGITFQQLLGLVGNPTNNPKEDGWWFIPSTYRECSAREKMAQIGSGQYSVLCFDIDEGNKALTEVRDVFQKGFNATALMAIYSSKNATEINRKWRVVVALAEPVGADMYTALLHCINDSLVERGLVLDRALEGPSQLVYLPNRGEFYESEICGDTPVTVPSDYMRDALGYYAETQNARTALAADDLLPEKKILDPDTGQMSVINILNRRTDMEAELWAYGCQPRGSRWLPPTSESGKAGITVMESKRGPWDVIYGHNSNETNFFQRICDPAEVRLLRMVRDGEANSRAHAIAKLASEMKAPLLDENGDWHGEELEMTIDQYNKKQTQGDAPAPTNTGDSVNVTMSKMPNEYMAPDDLYGELVRAVYNAQRRPNLMTAFMASAGTVAVIAGGWWAGPSDDDRLRFFMHVNGESGSGKETLFDAPNEIIGTLVYQTQNAETLKQRMPKTALMRIATPSGSAEGLEDLLETQGDILVGWDEIAGDFKQIANRASAHKASYLNALVRLFGKAKSSVAKRALAGNAEPKFMHAPNITVLSAATEEKLADNVDRDFLMDGTGARIMMFPCDVFIEPLRRDRQKMRISDELANNLTYIFNHGMGEGEGDHAANRVHNPKRIKFSKDAGDILFAVSAEADAHPLGSVKRGILNRTGVNAKALAMGRALVNNPLDPVVTSEVAQWAVWMVKYSNEYKAKLVGEAVSFSETDKARQHVLKRLRDLKEGEGLTLGRINQISSMRSLKVAAMRSGLLAELVNEGAITCHITTVSNNTTTIYAISDAARNGEV